MQIAKMFELPERKLESKRSPYLIYKTNMLNAGFKYAIFWVPFHYLFFETV